MIRVNQAVSTPLAVKECEYARLKTSLKLCGSRKSYNPHGWSWINPKGVGAFRTNISK